MRYANKTLWIVGANIALGAALAPIGLVLSRATDAVYVGNSLMAFVACFCGSSLAVLAQAIIALGLGVALHQVDVARDYPSLLEHFSLWVGLMYVHPNWPAPRQWLFRQVLSFRDYLYRSPFDGGSAACLEQFEEPKSYLRLLCRYCAVLGWRTAAPARPLPLAHDPARQIP